MPKGVSHNGYQRESEKRVNMREGISEIQRKTDKQRNTDKEEKRKQGERYTREEICKGRRNVEQIRERENEEKKGRHKGYSDKPTNRHADGKTDKEIQTDRHSEMEMTDRQTWYSDKHSKYRFLTVL